MNTENDDEKAHVDRPQNGYDSEWHALCLGNGRSYEHTGGPVPNVDIDTIVSTPILDPTVDPMISGFDSMPSNQLQSNQLQSPLEPFSSNEDAPAGGALLNNEPVEDIASSMEVYFQSADPRGNAGNDSHSGLKDVVLHDSQPEVMSVSLPQHIHPSSAYGNVQPPNVVREVVRSEFSSVTLSEHIHPSSAYGNVQPPNAVPEYGRSEQTNENKACKGKRKPVESAQIERVTTTSPVLKKKKPGAPPNYLIGAEPSNIVDRKRANKSTRVCRMNKIEKELRYLKGEMSPAEEVEYIRETIEELEESLKTKRENDWQISKKDHEELNLPFAEDNEYDPDQPGPSNRP